MIRVAIVGAGPYGLSLAAHLGAAGVEYRIFGKPMQTWTTRMPLGMSLKSEGFASNLYEPSGNFTLKSYCAAQNIPYSDVGEPVALQTFSEFGVEFADRFVSKLDRCDVEGIDRQGDGFVLRLDDSRQIEAASVVMAVGISHFAYLPDYLVGADAEHVSHSSQHRFLERFRGRRVTVLGSGASAIDIAGLLYEIGAETRIVARRSQLNFHRPPDREPRSLVRRIRSPRSGLGQGWKPLLSAHMPGVIHRLPAGARSEIYRRTLGPAPCWFTKDQIVGKVPTELGCIPEAFDFTERGVSLYVRDANGASRIFESDHVIAGTGYKIDLSRLLFLSQSIRSAIHTTYGSPTLSKYFESTVPGLFFTGLAAAQSFGPLLRFAFGAKFSAERLARGLASRNG